MNVYGVGSLNSPIVISDDEDEATVELELEQRLSSPRAGIDDDYDTYNDSYNIQQELKYSKSPHQNVFPCDETDETSMNGVAFGYHEASSIGYKRKRGLSSSPGQDLQQRLQPLTMNTIPQSQAMTIAFTPDGSKQARRKRAKRERLVTEVQLQTAMAGPSNSQNVAVNASTPLSHMPVIRHAHVSSLPSNFPVLSSLPPRPTGPLVSPLPLAFHGAGANPLGQSPTHLTHLILPPLPLLPQPPVPHTYVQTIQQTIPDNPVQGTSVVNIPYPVSKKPIGMPPDEEPHIRHGTYVLPANVSAPNAARTLVMELLPKKFRSLAFVRQWAMEFCSKPPVALRMELDIKAGKALIEFPTADIARAAFESGRLGGGLGKEHIRVWWYCMRGNGASAGGGELEEGEIEDGEFAKRAKNVKAKERKKRRMQAAEISNSLPKNPSLLSAPSLLQVMPPASFVPAQSSSSLSSPLLQFSPIPGGPISIVPQWASLAPPIPQPSFVPPQEQHSEGASYVPISPDRSLHVDEWMDLGSDDDMDYDAVEEREKPPIQEHLPDLEYADEVITTDDVYVASSQCGSHPPVVFPGQDDLIISEVVNPAESLATLCTPSVDSLWQAVPSGLQSPVVPVHAPAPRLPFPGDTMTMKTASHFIGGQLAGSYPSFIRPDSLQTEDSPNPSLPARIASPSGPPSTVPTPSVRSTISTPTPPPSEPRAMKNAPKGPTYVKRALLARQKELEEKIAKSKEHLATHSSGTATPDSTGEVSEGASEESVRRKLLFESNTHGRLEQTTDEKEDFLRQLVLQSKRKKALVVAYGPLTTIGGEEHPSTSIIMNQGPLIPQQVIVADDKPSLDDLASSFIAESIQLILQPAAYTQDNDNAAKIPEDRAKLVARQNIVNTCLKESKELLDKLATARTKEEKAELRKAFNESTRKKEAALEVLESLCDSPPVRSCATPVERFVWPRDSNAVVFVISDDEGEDEDDQD